MVEKTAVVVVDRHSGGGTVVIVHYAAGNGSVSHGIAIEAVVVIVLTAAIRGKIARISHYRRPCSNQGPGQKRAKGLRLGTGLVESGNPRATCDLCFRLSCDRVKRQINPGFVTQCTTGTSVSRLLSRSRGPHWS